MKKIAKDIQMVNTPNSSTINSNEGGLGNPECPICKGIGYYRLDLPYGHPDFGKINICDCRLLEVNRNTQDALFSMSNLDQLKHLTFANFHVKGRIGLPPRQVESLTRAFETCLRYSESLNGWMVIQGGYGCGKTHLASAIANLAVENGVSTLFLTVPDLLDSLRFSYDDIEENFEYRFTRIRTAGLVVMDDFGTQNATDWAKEKLFQIINFRYINRLPLVLTTNLNMKDIDGRIRSRLEDPELVEFVQIIAPDYRKPIGDTGYHELSSLSQKHKMRFESFSLRNGEDLSQEDVQSLEKALKASQDFCANPRGWLLLLGSFASGKTHLAASIAHKLEETGIEQLFVSVPEFLDHLRSTFSPTSQFSFDNRFDQVKNCQVLVLDDLSTQVMSPWVREKLYQLFNFRYENELPTVITSSDTLEGMDARIRSRLLDRRICVIYAITVPPFTGIKRTGSTRRKPVVQRKQ